MTVPDSPTSTDVLEQRVQTFETRLYHGTLIARASFPAAALLAVLTAAVTGQGELAPVIAWVAVFAWTAGTLPFAWRRMDWVTGLPWMVRLEIAVFVALAFLGLGSRSWHVLHAYVPLAFCAFFLSPRAGRLMTLALIASFWLSNAAARMWPALPIEDPIAPITPTALALTGWGLVTYVRRLVGDVRGIIAAQRSAGRALVVARQRLASQIERRRLAEGMGRRLGEIGAGLSPRPMSGEDVSGSRAALDGVLASIRHGIDALCAPDEIPGDARLGDLVRAAVAETEPLGGTVVLRIADDGGGDLCPVNPRPVARLLHEALANARRHGSGAVEVALEAAADGTTVEIRNPATAEPAPRPGHYGLEDMAADGADAGIRIARAFGDGHVSLRLHVPEIEVEGAGDPAQSLMGTLNGRRLAYERGILLVRLAFVVLTGVLLLVKADQHRTLLPVMVVTAFVLLAWNLILLLRWLDIRELVLRRPGLVWMDAGAMVVIITCQGGMSTPWIPLSMGSILTVVHFRSWRDGLTLVGLYGVALLIGYGLMRTLPVDDAGTLVQDMPFGWVLNVAAYSVVLAIAAGMRWVFDRAQEAGATYVETVRMEVDALRAAARDQARAETRRELHAKLRQYVAAARLRLGSVIDDDGGSPELAEVDRRLRDLRDELSRMMDDLDSGAAGPAPSGGEAPEAGRA